jgi:hypothetical protein
MRRRVMRLAHRYAAGPTLVAHSLDGVVESAQAAVVHRTPIGVNSAFWVGLSAAAPCQTAA